MSDKQKDAEAEMQKALEKGSLKLVNGKWMKHHLPGVKLRLAKCLLGRPAVENARRKAEQKANLPRRTILSAGSEKILGNVHGNRNTFGKFEGWCCLE